MDTTKTTRPADRSTADTAKDDSEREAAAAISPEAGVRRDPETGQALEDQSIDAGRVDDLPDGGAKSSRHTGEDAKR